MLIVGDLHFDAPPRYQHGSINFYLDKVTDALKHVLYEVAEEGETVVFVGDYFEKKDKILNKVKNSLFGVLVTAKMDKSLSYIFLVGNHDLSVDGECSVKFLSSIGKLVDSVEVLTVDGISVLFLPWSAPRSVDFELLDGVDCVIGHVPVRGVLFESGYYETGDDAFNLNDFLGKLVVLGHYHGRRIAGGLKVVGSLVQVDFGDLGEKGVFRIRVSGSGGISVESIKIPLFIDRMIVKVDSLEDLEKLWRAKDSLFLHKKFVRFDVNYRQLNIDDVTEFIREKLDMLFWYEVNFVGSMEDASKEKEAFLRDLGGKVVSGVYEYVMDKLSKVEDIAFRDLCIDLLRGVLED